MHTVIKTEHPDFYHNFVITRAIMRELQGQVSWGPIGDNEELTDALRTAFNQHKSIYDCFQEERHERYDSGNRNYYFLIRPNLPPLKIIQLHQFVAEFTAILLKYSHVSKVLSYCHYANDYLEKPVFQDESHVIPILQTMLQTSKTILEKESHTSQQPLFSVHNFFTEKKAPTLKMGYSRFVQASIAIASHILFSQSLQNNSRIVNQPLWFSDEDASSETDRDNASTNQVEPGPRSDCVII